MLISLDQRLIRMDSDAGVAFSLLCLVHILLFGGANSAKVWPVLLLIVTFLFKLGAAPFHNWAPDLYDGVPTTITAWMTNLPKLAV